jgi:hypothetical protein
MYAHFDPDYQQNSAIVDFGRDYSAGIVFSGLSAFQVTPIPEPASLLLLSPALLLCRAALNRRQCAKAIS